MEGVSVICKCEPMCGTEYIGATGNQCDCLGRGEMRVCLGL